MPPEGGYPGVNAAYPVILQEQTDKEEGKW